METLSGCRKCHGAAGKLLSMKMIRMKTPAAALLRVVGCVVLAGSIVACGKDGAAGSAGQSAAAVVTTQVVQPVAWSDTSQALGTVKARESVALTAKVSEIIEAVHFESGQSVRAGAPLVTLRNDSQQAALVSAQAAHAEAEQLYRRQQELAGQQLIARSTLDSQKAIRDAAEARVRQMRADIGDRSVRAPFAGVLGIRQVSPGSLVTANTVIATLDDIDRIFVDFQVPEGALASLTEGHGVAGQVAAWPGRDFSGTITTVDTRIDPVTRAATVRADFDNADHALRPGMLMNLRVGGASREVLAVPEIAVVQVGRDSFVYRVKDDESVEQTKVRAGTRIGNRVEILEGIQSGDRIVVDGTGKLRPGARITEAPAAEGARTAE